MQKPNMIHLLEVSYLWMDARQRLEKFSRQNGTESWREIMNDKRHPLWGFVDTLLHQEMNCAQLLLNSLQENEDPLAEALSTIVTLDGSREKTQNKAKSVALAELRAKVITQDMINEMKESKLINPRLSLRGVSPGEFLQLLYNFACWKIRGDNTIQMSLEDAQDIAEDSETGYVHKINDVLIDMHVWGLHEVKESEAKAFNERYGKEDDGHVIELVESMLAGLRKYGD